MKGPSGRPTRSIRKRKVAEKLKNVDISAIRHARKQRLDALENDNFAAEKEAEMLQGEEEFELVFADSDDEKRKRSKSKRQKPKRTRASNRLSGSSSRSRGNSGIEKWNKSYQQMIEEEDARDRPKGMVSALDIAARPSVRPGRPFCSVCGYKAPYTCKRCLVRFCSVKCGIVHDETRCLKFTA